MVGNECKKNGIFQYNKKWEIKNWSYEKGVEHTREEVRKMMNSIYPCLEFTTEHQSDFRTGYIPTLDSEWKLTKTGQILYRFYEKPMASPFCMMQDAAISEESKKATLSQEVIRRLENTSESEPDSVRVQIINKFITKMETSGYKEEKMSEIVKCGIKGYERKLEESNQPEERSLGDRDWCLRAGTF